MDATRTSCRADIDDQIKKKIITTKDLLLVLVAHRDLPLAWPEFSGEYKIEVFALPGRGARRDTTVDASVTCATAIVISRVHHEEDVGSVGRRCVGRERCSKVQAR